MAKARYRGDGTMRKVMPGLWFPARGVVVTDHDHGYEVELDVTVQKGKLVARELRVTQLPGGPPVTFEGIRLLPIAQITRAAGQFLQEEDPQAEGDVLLDNPRALTEADVKQMIAEGPTDRTLGTIAHLYRWAAAVGAPPVRLIEEKMGLSRSKTGRWIALARDRGFLGPSEGPGRASG